MRLVAPRVVHLTSVHRPADTRILERECRTLALAGYDVTLVASGSGDLDGGAVKIELVPRPASRIGRFLRTAPGVYRRARSHRADVYHLHDPELLPFGLALRLRGGRVIYDAHEDYGREILTKEWIHPRLRPLVAWATSLLEQAIVRSLDLVVAATPTIADRFPSERTVLVQNFPALDELGGAGGIPHRDRPPWTVYVGDLTPIRGAREMIAAMALTGRDDVSLVLGGRFSPASLEDDLRQVAGWERVQFRGWLDRRSVGELLRQGRMGLVVFHPTPAHIDAQPNKLFEYMGAGLPVVVSAFPAWQRLVDDLRCGLAVDPMKPDAIAGAVSWLLDNPDEAEAMGRRGRAAVEDRYNWHREAARLLEAYGSLG